MGGDLCAAEPVGVGDICGYGSLTLPSLGSCDVPPRLRFAKGVVGQKADDFQISEGFLACMQERNQNHRCFLSN